jgi:hypothetical protein
LADIFWVGIFGERDFLAALAKLSEGLRDIAKKQRPQARASFYASRFLLRRGLALRQDFYFKLFNLLIQV